MSFQTKNPVTGEVLPGEFKNASAEDVAQACEKCAEAAVVLRRKSGEELAQLLEVIGASLNDAKEAEDHVT